MPFFVREPIRRWLQRLDAALTETDQDVADLQTSTSGLIPTSGQKDALIGTSGTPGSGNKYVTDGDSRNTNSRAPTGSASGDLGGTYPSPTVTQSRGVRETSGPTTLTVGAITDGQVIQRSGSTLIGVSVGVVTDKAAVYLAAATNSHGASTNAKIPMDTVVYDTNSIWNVANKRFIPKKAGYYLVNMRVRRASSGGLSAQVGLNGSPVQALGTDTSANFSSGASSMVVCNGTTDYVEAWAFCQTAIAYTTGAFDTWMNIVGPL